MYNFLISVEESVKQLSDQFEHRSDDGIYNIYKCTSITSVCHKCILSFYVRLRDAGKRNTPGIKL